jgi:hypothetical protein
MSTRYIPRSAWTRKAVARHFAIARARKADRAVKAWRRKGKTVKETSIR